MKLKELLLEWLKAPVTQDAEIKRIEALVKSSFGLETWENSGGLCLVSQVVFSIEAVTGISASKLIRYYSKQAGMRGHTMQDMFEFFEKPVQNDQGEWVRLHLKLKKHSSLMSAVGSVTRGTPAMLISASDGPIASLSQSAKYESEDKLITVSAIEELKDEIPTNDPAEGDFFHTWILYGYDAGNKAILLRDARHSYSHKGYLRVEAAAFKKWPKLGHFFSVVVDKITKLKGHDEHEALHFKNVKDAVAQTKKDHSTVQQAFKYLSKPDLSKYLNQVGSYRVVVAEQAVLRAKEGDTSVLNLLLKHAHKDYRYFDEIANSDKEAKFFVMGAEVLKKPASVLRLAKAYLVSQRNYAERFFEEVRKLIEKKLLDSNDIAELTLSLLGEVEHISTDLSKQLKPYLKEAEVTEKNSHLVMKAISRFGFKLPNLIEGLGKLDDTSEFFINKLLRIGRHQEIYFKDYDKNLLEHAKVDGVSSTLCRYIASGRKSRWPELEDYMFEHAFGEDIQSYLEAFNEENPQAWSGRWEKLERVLDHKTRNDDYYFTWRNVKREYEKLTK